MFFLRWSVIKLCIIFLSWSWFILSWNKLTKFRIFLKTNWKKMYFISTMVRQILRYFRGNLSLNSAFCFITYYYIGNQQVNLSLSFLTFVAILCVEQDQNGTSEGTLRASGSIKLFKKSCLVHNIVKKRRRPLILLNWARVKIIFIYSLRNTYLSFIFDISLTSLQ